MNYLYLMRWEYMHYTHLCFTMDLNQIMYIRDISRATKKGETDKIVVIIITIISHDTIIILIIVDTIVVINNITTVLVMILMITIGLQPF